MIAGLPKLIGRIFVSSVSLKNHSIPACTSGQAIPSAFVLIFLYCSYNSLGSKAAALKGVMGRSFKIFLPLRLGINCTGVQLFYMAHSISIIG